MSDNPAEEKKSIFDAMPENPTLTESPWKPGSPCTFALFGKNQLITSIARLSEHGTLTIFPANPEVPAKDGWLIVKGGEGDDDLLIGGGGDDHFVFGPDFGEDRIIDFNLGTLARHDTLDLRGLGFASRAEVLAHTDGGGSAVIHAGDDSITLQGVSVAQLSAADHWLLL
jgi:Ca2+-binding RTX toxin-like protein